MTDTVMTFGECLDSLMRSKKISVTRLAELTGARSRTSIHRILKDESSLSIIKDFKNRLVKLDELDWQEAEIGRLEEAIGVSRAGKDTYQARKILLPVFDLEYRGKLEVPRGFDPVDQTNIGLNELFETYKDFASIKILILDIVSVPFVSQLLNLASSSPPGMITISHIMYLGSSRSHNAAAFASAFELFNHQQYSLYTVRTDLNPGSSTHLSSGSVIVKKTDRQGNHFTDLIKINADDTFIYVVNIPGDSLFAFYEHLFDQVKTNSPNIRRVYDAGDALDTGVELNTQSMPCNELTRYYIRQNFYIRMLPIDIFRKISAETDYWGRTEDDPAIIRLFELLTFRYNTYYNDTLKLNLFTKRGLLDFVKNGVFTDHFCYIRPFNKEEIKAILEFVLDKLEHDDYFKILLLKDNYALGNLEFTYMENHSLWVYDSYSGYNDDYYEYYFDSPEMLEICDDFIKNELLPNHTLPEAETIAYFKYLISII